MALFWVSLVCLVFSCCAASAVRGSSPLTRTLILSSHICHALLQRTNTHTHTATALPLRWLSRSLSLSLTLSELSTPGYSTLSRIVFAEICFSVTQHLTTLLLLLHSLLPLPLLRLRLLLPPSLILFICHHHRLASLVLMSYKN